MVKKRVSLHSVTYRAGSMPFFLYKGSFVLMFFGEDAHKFLTERFILFLFALRTSAFGFQSRLAIYALAGFLLASIVHNDSMAKGQTLSDEIVLPIGQTLSD